MLIVSEYHRTACGPRGAHVDIQFIDFVIILTRILVFVRLLRVHKFIFSQLFHIIPLSSRIVFLNQMLTYCQHE